MRTLAAEQAAGKYAHIERERRWLVDRVRRPPLDDGAAVMIEDRYIVGTRLRLRRMTDAATGCVVLKLTKKYDAADPTARPIVTAYLAEAEYAVFAALPAAALVKRRYPVDGFSLDIFAGTLAGLELVEIETDDAAALAAVVPPPWAGGELTRDARYSGGALASAGRPEE